MNTFTNTQQVNRKSLRRIIALGIALALVIGTTIAVFAGSRPVTVATPQYSNALEMQYAQPWLDVQNKPVAAYGNALESQYAQPWLEGTKLLIPVTGGELPLACGSSLELFYACKYGYARP